MRSGCSGEHIELNDDSQNVDDISEQGQLIQEYTAKEPDELSLTVDDVVMVRSFDHDCEGNAFKCHSTHDCITIR